jgi:hypothetical protein
MNSQPSESFLYQTNHAISPFLSISTWSYMEIIIGVILFLMCLYARVNDPKFTSQNTTRGFIETKIIQFGLFLQMLISIFAIVDGYQIELTQNEPHIMLIILLFSSICIKADLIVPSLKPESILLKKVLDKIR